MLQADAYEVKVKGEENSMEYRAFFTQASHRSTPLLIVLVSHIFAAFQSGMFASTYVLYYSTSYTPLPFVSMILLVLFFVILFITTDPPPRNESVSIWSSNPFLPWYFSRLPACLSAPHYDAAKWISTRVRRGILRSASLYCSTGVLAP